MEEVSIDNILISSDEEDMSSKTKTLKKKKRKRDTTETVQAKEKCTPVKSGKGKSPTKKSGKHAVSPSQITSNLTENYGKSQ